MENKPWTEQEAIDALIEIARNPSNAQARIAAIKELSKRDIQAPESQPGDDLYPEDELASRRT